MNKYLIYATLFVITITTACRKTQNEDRSSPITSARDSLPLKTVINWFNAQYPQTSLLTNNHTFSPSRLDIDWSKAESIPGQSSNYWLLALKGQPTVGHVKYGYRKLLIAKDSAGALYSRILEIVPDVLYYQRAKQIHDKDFTGRLFVYNDAYQLLGGIIYHNGTKAGRIAAGKHEETGKPALATQAIHQTCYWFDSSYFDAEGVFTIHSDSYCSYSIDNDVFQEDTGGGIASGDALGGGGGTDASNPPAPSNLPYEDHSKINPRDYMNCFTQIANAGATMTVTLYVVEPEPGTTFNLGSNSVGHVAIGLTKTNGSQSITQTVGYYPDATGLAKLHAPSKIVDNDFLDYNVSITYSVNATQFQQIINEIASPPLTYDLETNNCTTFAYNTLLYGGIQPPSPYSTLYLAGPTNYGEIMSPAGIGESIRAMNGKPGVNTNGGTTGPSHGPCN